MIFDINGKTYSKIEFSTEEEVENVIINNFKLLFGDYSILLPKNIISTSGGKGTIPDDYVIPVSDTRAYKQFGNSVVVPLFHAVAEFIKPIVLSMIEKEAVDAQQNTISA